ncbi:inactive protein kinase SELMODRAFT_444075-like isoform X2 [Magnolia sinica]|uniref:inactive protein kinase SELMODRAFT_444075-like isoform X2 n=1 Tax=Magnolia sinica TaxID=86752 RepID=UPI002658637E|nr:inactive protein kinase SELMODRAFT_444075-like isoform X2 [Magnolia sinica]
MSEAAKRVVVIQDASRNISSTAIKWILQGLQLKPGDALILLGVLHQVNTPMGYKSRVGSSSIVGANKNIIKEAVTRKMEEYHNSKLISEIRKLYETNQVEFNVKVVAAASPKIVALDIAKKLRATWIILDRQMKKDKKYFLEKLSCGISRMKRDDSVEELRGPRDRDTNNMHTVRSRNSSVTYDEMIPGTPDDETSPKTTDDAMRPGTPEDDLFSLELSPRITRGAYKNSLVKEPRTDNEPQWGSTTTSSFSKSISSELLQLLSPNMRNPEASSSSSFNEAKHFPLENESYTDSRCTTAEDEMPDAILDGQKLDQAEANEILYSDPRQRQSSFYARDFFMFGLTVNSVCSECTNERPKIGSTTDFTYAELEAATNKFSQENYLSEGGFGSVYKGKLKNGIMIAVKQHKHASSQGEKEFKSEVHVLSRARHKNVVMLLGLCSEGNHRLLVYEFVCNGSLDRHLSKKSPKTLSWKDRMKIALGAARGLQYLHENNIIHRDMRPNNILVTHDYEPLLGDFGLARTQNEGSDHSSDTRVVGTFGYLAPEYAESGKVSTKTDVYSFGVVLLQLITGRTTIDKELREKSLIGWARPLLKERKYPDLIDPRILDSHDVHQLFCMVQLAEKCLRKDPERRLSMDKVVGTLERILKNETVSGIEDFSPANSDSVSSIPEYNDTHADNETVAEERRFSPELSPVSSRSQMSEAFSTASSAKTSSTSNTSKSSKSSISRGRKGHRNNRMESGSQPQFPYGNMLN